MGPTLYITVARGLKAKSKENELIKYADDTSLLVPQHSKCSIEAEYSNIVDWSEKNKLRINITKTKEIVFWRTKQASKKHNIPMIQNIERVEHAKLLGVHFVSDMTWSIHLDHVLSKVSQSFYLLNQLKQMQLNISGLNTVYRAISLSQIEYALPVFSGALRQSDIERINSTVRKDP